MTTKQTPERTISQLPSDILTAIIDGHLDHSVEKVTISAKTSPTGKEEAREFDALYALDVEGMSILCGGKLEPKTLAPSEGKDERSDEQKRLGACDHFNYGRILSVRQQVRSALEESLEGFEKSILKLAKTNFEGGMADSLEEARDMVVARWLKQGKLPADYVFPTNYKG